MEDTMQQPDSQMAPRAAPKKSHTLLLVIIVAGVLVVLAIVGLFLSFSLGVYSSRGSFGNICIASPGYECTDIHYTSSTGMLSFVLGQDTGETWSNASVVVSANSGGETPQQVFASTTPTQISALVTGQTTTVNVPFSLSSGNGSGDIFVEYTVPGNTTPAYAQVAVFTIS